jgi:hypothetical protein
MWPDPSQNEANIRWVRDYYDATAPLSEEGGYINFMAGDDQDRIRANYPLRRHAGIAEWFERPLGGLTRDRHARNPERSTNGSTPAPRSRVCKSIRLRKAPLCAALQSPLPDSNRRTPSLPFEPNGNR